MRKFFIACVFFVVLAFWKLSFAQSFRDVLDRFAFQSFGKTFFSHPEDVSISHLFIDTEAIHSDSVIVEGKVLLLGSQSSFLVLENSLSKLVVLMGTFADLDLDKLRGLQLRVLGMVEKAPNGFPLLKAVAFKEN